MARGKVPKTRDKELKEIQRLKHDNVALKRQLNRLRKQIARVNLDRFENVRDALEADHREDEQETKLAKQRRLIERWQCFHCGEDYLRLLVINRPDGEFYFRKCPNCDHRTRMQRFDKGVEGPES
tara:strand:+ start:132 stop:506 length:375 start_codon:yes stop_codon:yes gene_type:complete